MNPSKQKLLQMLILTLTDSHYQQLFHVTEQHEWANLGFVASTNKSSKIFRLLNALSSSLEEQLVQYKYTEPKKSRPLSKRQLKILAEQNKQKEKEDSERFSKLEASWKSPESIAQDAKDHKEMLETAERCAQNIFKLNQSLKGIKG